MSYTNQPDSTEIRFENGLILFDAYELYKERAKEARDYLIALDVRPESEQECKRTVATARKISEQLNQEKIRIKKEVLEPYNACEEKVKEIIGIITEGENVARDKLKAIDDLRREAKKEEICKIWENRAWAFECGHFITVDRFLQDRHLNKTVPISEVEKEMVQFLQEKSEDILLLSRRPLKDEYIAEYLNCLNALKAMDTVDRRHELVQEISAEPYMVIRITGKANVILAKQMLKDVEYKIMEEK